MQLQLLMENRNKEVFQVAAEGDVVWETNRMGQPGKLTFSVIPDKLLSVTEGNAVRLDVDGTPLFFGYLFEQSRGKDGIISMTAYDQLRYLKNKDTYSYDSLTATQLIQRIANDYRLNLGTLEDTGHVIDHRYEKNKTLFDIIQNALNITMMRTKERYTLYDAAGYLTLKNMGNMQITLLVDQETAEDYDYKTGIDKNTYNQIKVMQSSTEESVVPPFMTKHTENINQWGILQYLHELQEGEDGKLAAETLLELYNKRGESLSIKKALGDVTVRAGSLLPIILDLGDAKLNNMMLAEQVKHTFSGGSHSMDLSLRGHDFYG